MSIQNITTNIQSYFKERTPFDWCFLLFGIFTQIITYIITNDSTLSLISGISGILSVVLCSQRKISFYAFSIIQMITYVILCFQQHLYGEIIENGFYFITMMFGIYIWAKHYDNYKVIAKSFTIIQWIITILIMLLCITLFAVYLNKTNDTQPLLDSITTVPAFIAQILMILRYKEQWIFWLIIDIGSVIMWAIAGNYCMMTQFIFWIANCIYGYILWDK